MLRNSGNLSAAQVALQEALSHAPSDRTVLSNLSALHVLLGHEDPSTARAAFDRALAYDSTNADALYNLGVLEAGDQNFEKAIFYYQTCVRCQPLHTLAWNNLGVVYQQVCFSVPTGVFFGCSSWLDPVSHLVAYDVGQPH